MNYIVVFDTLNYSYPWFTNNKFEFIMILLIILVYLVINKYFKDYIEIKLSLILPIIAIIIIGTCFFNFFSYSAYQTVKTGYLNKQCKIIKGYVENVSVKYGRMATQRFSVQNITFEISDNIINGGYNTTVMNGGTIRENEYIRLHYIEKSNDERIIAKLEIRK